MKLSIVRCVERWF